MWNFNVSDENIGVEDAKIPQIPPTFNSRNVIQFDLSPGVGLNKIIINHI